MNILGIGRHPTSESRSSASCVPFTSWRARSRLRSRCCCRSSTPFDWANPTKTTQSGEIEVMNRRGSRSVLLSLPAVLAHVSKVLHKEVS
jgi:hypothetical protein